MFRVISAVVIFPPLFVSSARRSGGSFRWDFASVTSPIDILLLFPLLVQFVEPPPLFGDHSPLFSFFRFFPIRLWFVYCLAVPRLAFRLCILFAWSRVSPDFTFPTRAFIFSFVVQSIRFLSIRPPRTYPCNFYRSPG